MPGPCERAPRLKAESTSRAKSACAARERPWSAALHLRAMLRLSPPGFERFFQSPIEWSAPRTEMVLDAKLLALPLIKADESLAAFFEKHATEMLAK